MCSCPNLCRVTGSVAPLTELHANSHWVGSCCSMWNFTSLSSRPLHIFFFFTFKYIYAVIVAYDGGLSPREFVADMKRKNQLIMGIGHRVKSLQNPDMRVSIIKVSLQCICPYESPFPPPLPDVFPNKSTYHLKGLCFQAFPPCAAAGLCS